MTLPTHLCYVLRATSGTVLRATSGTVLAIMLSLLITGCQRPTDTEAVAQDTDQHVDTDSAAADETDKTEQPSSEQPNTAPATDQEEPKAVQAIPASFAESHPFPVRQPAPKLEGGVAWLNSAGPIDIKDLRGKFVILDFWTYCCINCIQVLPELKKLEEAYPNELVVIGVHSAKFDTEKNTDNIREAILRYEIKHPVINDAEHKVWNNYFVRSWPSFRVIDPEGNLVGGDSGEIEFKSFDAFMKRHLPYYRRRGLLDLTPLKFDLEAQKERQTPLRFPGKVLADEKGGRLFIADSNHNRIVIASLDGKLIETIGSGTAGTKDGDYTSAELNDPQGMFLDGDTLWIADTDNHMIRKVDLKAKGVKKVAGTGKQRRGIWPSLGKIRVGPNGQSILPDKWVGRPIKTELASPWAVLVHKKNLYIAMAGPHQIWKMPLNEREIGPWAGNGREDIVDGPHLPKRPFDVGYSSFAQPSGLTTDGEYLYVADCEGSAIRAVPFDTKKPVVTVVGKSLIPGKRLFDFGDVDGKGDDVRLQHALGVVFHRGMIYTADTYNNKVKTIDPRNRTSITLIGDGKPGTSDDPARLDEPGGITAAGDTLYIADTNNHLIRTFNLKTKKLATLDIKGLMPPVIEPKKYDPRKIFTSVRTTKLAPAKVAAKDRVIRLQGKIELPFGWKMNTAAPLTYLVESKSGDVIAGESLGKLKQIEKPSVDFEIALPVSADAGEAKLSIGLQFYYCRDGAEGVCKEFTGRFNFPIKIDASATADKPALLVKVRHKLSGKKP
jgi:thiol-disulfide isomerase/thioredoxin